jgi:hypothetical protein
MLDHSSYHPAMAKKKNPAAQALGRLGGLKGGKARFEVLTPERRSEIAKAGADKRWAKHKAKKNKSAGKAALARSG